MSEPLPAAASHVDPAKSSGKPSLPFLWGPELSSRSPDEIEREHSGRPIPEAVRMYLALARGQPLGQGVGWYGPGQSRHSWKWLATRHQIASDGAIHPENFQGPRSWFDRFDRNGDGLITEEDLDWSTNSAWVQQAYIVNRLFRRMDPNGDGRISREDWLAYFDAVAQGGSEVNSEQMRAAWLGGMSGHYLPGDAPTPELLMQSLFDGSLGSPYEGPELEAPAVDFTLLTVDGQRRIQLSEVMGPRPVVLVFGNFTCGPFRSMFPGVDDVARRFEHEALFLGVYVREAHPTNGWQMGSNAAVGVAVAQPRTDSERQAVAGQFQRLLRPSFPLVVDDLQDSTGHAYSAMPARCYVIDRAGRIAYKAGRGPFGFKTGEMEQALLMTLMDESRAA